MPLPPIPILKGGLSSILIGIDKEVTALRKCRNDRLSNGKPAKAWKALEKVLQRIGESPFPLTAWFQAKKTDLVPMASEFFARLLEDDREVSCPPVSQCFIKFIIPHLV